MARSTSTELIGTIAPAKAYRPGRPTSGARTSLPLDVVADAARRVRIVAMVYAATFLLVGPLATLISSTGRAGYFDSVLRWGPSAVSIVMALLVVAISQWRRFAPTTVLRVGLLFEVAGSYGIAASRYLDVQPVSALPPVSWVAVWILVFATIVPSPPARAFAAAIASATSVPAMVSAGGWLRGDALSPLTVVRVFVPYLLVALLAYVVARVVYRLGTELTQARELGSYRLIERLGEGGMGEVWRAEHQLLARPAAIKLIRPSLAHDVDAVEFRSRFEREAQATASLHSPHTIQLYDFGVADDGTFYYVMELLHGFDLQTLVERHGPVPVNRALHLLSQMCHSLGEAHGRGLIHRDVKPANVYVCRLGRDVDVVKVLDFGLVTPALAPADGATHSLVSSGHVARGTPAFMAPEQAMGDRPTDPRTDIYALGCVAYWLVSGQTVFESKTPIEAIVKHAHDNPTAPSTRTAHPVPPEFDALVLSCLAKRPEDRPSTVDEVASRLRHVPGAPWTHDDAHAWWTTYAPLRSVVA